MTQTHCGPIGEGWYRVDPADLPKGEVLLYFPEIGKGGRNHRLPMYRIGYVGSYPHRLPTHWARLYEPRNDL